MDPRFPQAQSLFEQEDYQRSSELCDALLREGYRFPELFHLKGLNCIRFNQLLKAQEFLDESLALNSSNEKVWLDVAYIYAKQGSDNQALEAYRQAIDLNPYYSIAYNGVAVIHARRGDKSSAIETLQKAIQINPDDQTSELNLARLFEDGAQYLESLTIFQRLLEKDPSVENFSALVRLCRKLEQPESAIKVCQKGIAAFPGNFSLNRQLLELTEEPAAISAERDQEIRSQLQAAFQHLQPGQDQQTAEQIFQGLYQTCPDHPHLLHDYGLFCLMHGQDQESKIEKGVAMLERAILRYPQFVMPYASLCRFLMQRNQFKRALEAADEGLRFNAETPDLLHVKGIALKELGQLGPAIASLEAADQLHPEAPLFLYSDLGLLYSLNGQFTKAQTYYQRASEIDPNYYPARFNQGLLLSRSGLVDESIEIFESLPELDRNAYEALLYAAACHPEKYRQLPQYLENWAETYASHVVMHTGPFTQRNRGKIRVGYVSPDFRRHPVSYFMIGPYMNHDTDQFEIFSYYNGTAFDDYTGSLQEYSFDWRNVKEMSDQALIEQISKDKIDILVDLSGHTSNNRLPAFVGKPAPIQVTYLGYLTTTGIAQIDYRLIDSYAKPDVCTEELIELPNCYLCYQPFMLDLTTSQHAHAQNGQVTLGSFHRLPKIHSRLIRVWSEILKRAPDTKFLMKTKYLDAPDIQSKILEQFTGHGIDPDRIIFRGHAASYADHLGSYDQIDLMLDAFPYNGTTITCESLWMGVPVVTLAGDLHLSRVGVSINTNAGLGELIGQNEDEYIKIAVELAKAHDQISDYNSNLRDRFLNSVVCDPVTFTQNLEAAYRQMYRRWIDSK